MTATAAATVKLSPAPKKVRKAKKQSKPSPAVSMPQRRQVTIKARQRMAKVVGGVGVAVLFLSVFHCTEAIARLTGSGLVLASLLAVGIDCGLVVAELAAILAHDNAECKGWAIVYIVLAVLLSCLLNGWASSTHAEEGMKVAAWIVGGLVPVLVFLLGKIAGLLWQRS